MRTFIQLRDGIGYAVINTEGEPDHSNTPSHTTSIEVFTDNPEKLIRKKYNQETKEWSDAPVIRFAEYNENGDLLEIRRTVFVHEIPDNSAIMPDKANGLWKFINGDWVSPEVIASLKNQAVTNSLQVSEEPNFEEILEQETSN